MSEPGTELDLARMRAVAEAVDMDEWWDSLYPAEPTMVAFIEAFSPETVLALLDRLEAAERR